MNNDSNNMAAMLFQQLENIYFRKSPLRLDEFLRGEMKVLSYICREKRELLPGQLSAQLKMTGGRIAGILRSLEKKGYIIRRTDESDRRRVLVNITESGISYIASSTEILSDRLDRLVNFMGTENTQKLIDALDIFMQASESVCETELPICGSDE